MKQVSILLVLICSIFFSKAQGPNTTIISVPKDGGGGTYQAVLTLPDDYGTTTKAYPFILFAHGNGEAGTDISEIYNNQSNAGGPAKFVFHNQWPTSFTNPVDGQPYKFIVLSPQQPNAANGSLDWTSVDFIVNYMKAHYRIDLSRFYMTGLSGGGQVGYVYVSACCGITNQNTPAAMVEMSIGGGKPNQAGINATKSKGINVWGFGSESDALGINTHLWISGDYGGQSCSCGGLGALGRWTPYVGGHCCWDQFYDPTYKETINGKQMNIYEWMLQFTTGSSAPASNQPPVVNAGPDLNVTLPNNTVTLAGTASDPNGSISAYSWTQTSGTAATIVNPTSASTNISGITSPGSRTFRLTVTDNLGATSTDEVVVTVFAAAGSSIADTININFFNQTSYANSAWNNVLNSQRGGNEYRKRPVSLYRWEQFHNSGNALSANRIRRQWA